MNALEAGLLDRSINGLSDTLITNRQMDARAKEAAVRSALESEALGIRREDNADARENRRLSLEEQKAHQARLEKIASEGNATKRNQMYLEFLAELNKTGQLTDDGLSRMEDAFNQQFGGAGLGVKLFRVAPQKTPVGWKSPSGTDYTVFGNTIERDLDPRVTVTEETDEMGNPKRKLQRRVNPADLDAEMAAGRASKSLTGDPIKDARIAEIDKQIAEHAAALATGDESSGIRSLVPYAFKNRRPAIAALQSEKAQLLGQTNAPTSEPLASPVRPAGVPTVATQEDFDKLPSGAKYINAKDRKTYTKP